MSDDSSTGVWKTLGARTVFDAQPWFSVSVEKVQLPDGRIVDDYYQLNLPDYVAIVAYASDGRMVLVRQYRHGSRAVRLGLPGGIVEKNEEALATARRELREETGYSSEKWTPMGGYIPHSNYGCGRGNFFLVSDAYVAGEPNSGDLEGHEVVLMDRADVMNAIRKREITSLSSVAAILLAEDRMGRNT